MKTTVTNPSSVAFDFSGIVVKPGVSVLDDVPSDVLRSMADAGMVVEFGPKVKATEQPRVAPASAVPVPLPPAKAKSEAPVSTPKKTNE